jgi:hypothetical protein
MPQHNGNRSSSSSINFVIDFYHWLPILVIMKMMNHPMTPFVLTMFFMTSHAFPIHASKSIFMSAQNNNNNNNNNKIFFCIYLYIYIYLCPFLLLMKLTIICTTLIFEGCLLLLLLLLYIKV